MNAKNSQMSRAMWWSTSLFLLIVVVALGWFSGSPARAGWDVTPMPEEGPTCASPENLAPVVQHLPLEDPTAFNPLVGMSLDQIRNATQTLTPEAAHMLTSLDIQFHNLYPSMALNGPTAETSVTIQTDLCVKGMWAQIIMPAQSTGNAKFAYALKSPSSILDRLQDWVRFPFPAINGTATAGMGLDGFTEGVYPFTWVIGYDNVPLITQDGFFAVGACCGTCGSSPGESSAVFSADLESSPPEGSAPLDSLADMSLDQIKEAAQTLTPEAAQMLTALDIQFHNLYPGTTLDGPTAVTSVTIQSDLCVQDMWAQIILPAQSTGNAKLAQAFKSPSSVWDRLSDWVRFPFPAVNGTATAGVGLDGFVEGVYPFTWVIGSGDTVLMTQDGIFTVGACCCGDAFVSSGALSATANPLDGMSLEQIKQATQTLTPEAAQVVNSLDIQFHDLYPSMALNGPTAVTSVTIQSTVCVQDMWAQIILPAQSTGNAKLANAFKSPSSVWDRLSDWVRFPFPAVKGPATAGVGMDGFVEGVYPFTWVVGYGDTALMTQDGFLTVGSCCCGALPLPTPTPLPTPMPTVDECIQHSPERVDVLMGANQTLYREVEFANTCDVTWLIDLGFSDLVSQIYLAGGHDQIALSPDERQVVRLYFSTGSTVPSYSTELVATSSGDEAAQIPISIGPGAVIQASASLDELNGVNLLTSETGVFSGTIKNNSSLPLVITGTAPTALPPWLSMADSSPAMDVSVLWRQPRWELEPGDEGRVYIVLHSLEESSVASSFYLESQYGDRQEIPVAVRFGPYADLEILGPTLPTQMSSGDVVTVVVTVTNPGPSDAPTVTMPITLRGDAAVTGVTTSPGVICTSETSLVCNVPQLLAGGSVTMVIRLKAAEFQSGSTSPSLMGASLRGEILTDLYDPHSPNNVWVTIWGGAHIYLPLVGQNWQTTNEPAKHDIYLPLVLRDR